MQPEGAVLNYLSDACPGPASAVPTYGSFEQIIGYYIAISPNSTYSNNMYCSYTVCPARPGESLVATFLTAMIVEPNYDYVTLSDTAGYYHQFTGNTPAVSVMSRTAMRICPFLHPEKKCTYHAPILSRCMRK